MYGKNLGLLVLTIHLMSAAFGLIFASGIAAAQDSLSRRNAYDCGLCSIRDYPVCDDRDYDRPEAPACYRCNARDYEFSTMGDYEHSTAPSPENYSARSCGRCNVRDCVTC